MRDRDLDVRYGVFRAVMAVALAANMGWKSGDAELSASFANLDEADGVRMKSLPGSCFLFIADSSNNRNSSLRV